MRPRLRKPGDRALLHLLNPQAALFEERRDVPRQVQAREQNAVDRLPKALPASDTGTWGGVDLEEDQFALRLQHPDDAPNRVAHPGNRAEREGTHDRVDRGVAQRNALAWKIDELDIEVRGPAPVVRQLDHPGIRLEGMEPLHSGRVVVNKVDARTDTDL